MVKWSLKVGTKLSALGAGLAYVCVRVGGVLWSEPWFGVNILLKWNK